MVLNNVLVRGENTNASKKVISKSPSKIHQLIDLLDQPDHMKKDLPWKQLRDTSLNLEADNKSKHQKLATSGYKMTDQMITTLCLGPSKYQLFNDVLAMVTKYIEPMKVNEKSISRASIFKLKGYLTNHYEAVLTVIDYVTIVCINKPWKLLQDACCTSGIVAWK